MNKNIKKWLEGNVEGYEIHESSNGGFIIFVPIAYQNQAIKYFRRYGFRHEYRASYTWIAFFAA